MLESAQQAKGVDTVEQPIQSQQSKSLLNESEPTAASPKQTQHHHVEPASIQATSSASSNNKSWLVISFVAALLAGCCL